MNLKNISWERHFMTAQPPTTFGKRVLYKTADGHVCMPWLADELNWRNASFGRIVEYVVL